MGVLLGMKKVSICSFLILQILLLERGKSNAQQGFRDDPSLRSPPPDKLMKELKAISKLPPADKVKDQDFEDHQLATHYDMPHTHEGGRRTLLFFGQPHIALTFIIIFFHAN